MIIPINNIDNWYLYQHQQNQKQEQNQEYYEESFQDILDKLLGKGELLCQ